MALVRSSAADALGAYPCLSVAERGGTADGLGDPCYNCRELHDVPSVLMSARHTPKPTGAWRGAPQGDKLAIDWFVYTTAARGSSVFSMIVR